MTMISPDTGVWLRRYAPSDVTDKVLVCFPHAGGSATFYLPVARALASVTDVVALQYPGRQDRRADPCIDDLGALADAIVPQLLPLVGKQIRFFGHSMGATLAFEVARRLEATGTEITCLVASGRRAPSRHRDETVHLSGDDGLLAELTKLSGTDAKLLADEEVRQMILPSLRSDYKAAETYRYRPGPPLRCPIIALAGDADPKATLDEVAAWEEHTTGPFRFRQWPGGHFFLSDHQAEVLDVLREEIGRG
ncbi:thioesterase II family protein [Nocardia terpenica]|uniref:Thioesterase TesA n=1 Tax=Nocardia terpenica TaxID=455432 RepID=A0A6G9YYD1_9NOCA|nr:alpha/beta fold hydrolase [Nocardia terpenica]QIS18224.1 alpha/beta fold hydrolase [Nocardia terpenica]